MFIYTPHFIPDKIIIIGAGGTGSRLVPLAAQFMKTIAWAPDLSMYIFDFDKVETKNLTRQNFIAPDVGKYKSEVLAGRYSKAFGVEITAVTDEFSAARAEREVIRSESDKRVIFGTGDLHNSIICMCVDSAKARRDILKVIMNLAATTDRNQNSSAIGSMKNVFVIDSGNENDYGQIKIFHPGVPGMHFNGYSVSNYNKDEKGRPMTNLAAVKSAESALVNGLMPYDVALPSICYEFYAGLQDNVSTGSCADLDQTLAINASMATLMMSAVQNFFYRKPFTYHTININLSHGATPQYITLDWLIKTICQPTSVGKKSNIDGSMLPEVRNMFPRDHVNYLTEEYFTRIANQMQIQHRKMFPAKPVEKKEIEKDKPAQTYYGHPIDGQPIRNSDVPSILNGFTMQDVVKLAGSTSGFYGLEYENAARTYLEHLRRNPVAITVVQPVAVNSMVTETALRHAEASRERDQAAVELTNARDVAVELAIAAVGTAAPPPEEMIVAPAGTAAAEPLAEQMIRTTTRVARGSARPRV